MTLNRLSIPVSAGPKQRQRHYSYDENVDQSPKLIEDEATDIEHEVPMDENESVEGQQDQGTPEPPTFEGSRYRSPVLDVNQTLS